MSLYDLARQRQAQTKPPKAAVLLAFSLVEALKKARELVGRNANPLISHRKHNLIVLAVGVHGNVASLGAELGGIIEQVVEDLLQIALVSADLAQVWTQFGRDAQAFSPNDGHPCLQ